jgi:hypothetical protein
MSHALNSERSVAVAMDYFWQDMDTCPRGVKVQLLGNSGVAHYSMYDGKELFWVGWAPLPRRRPE